jgi:hypothetical protein
MKKADSLRAFLVARVPELARAPDRLSMYVKSGSVAARWSNTKLSFSYDFTLAVTILDFGGHPDQIFLPVLLWLKDNEISLLQDFGTADQVINFDCDLVDEHTVDVAFELKLSEAVDVLPADNGSYQLGHRDEPPPAGGDLFPGIAPDVLLKAVYDQQGELIIQAADA